MSEPLPVSVVIPAWNREQMVGRAIASAQNQTPAPPTEIIVVDDGSTDGTARAAEAAGARVVRRLDNSGAAAARNAGVAVASQPWIALLDSDDEWLPHLLATLWPLRRGHVLISGASVASGEGRYGGPLDEGPTVIGSPGALVFPENFIASSGVIFDRRAFDAVHGYDPARSHAEDLDLWLRMLELGTGLAVSTVVTRYHRHSGQKSQDLARAHREQRAILDHYADRPWLTPELIERRLAVQAWDEFRDALDREEWATAANRAFWLVRRRRRGRAVVRTLRRRRAQRRRGVQLAHGPG